MTEDHRVVKQLRRVAAKLTGDLHLQKDLMQEMFIHLVRMETELPGNTSSWYIKCCQFHARNYLRRGRSVDSIKRANILVPLGLSDDGDDSFYMCADAPDPIDLHSELITRDIVDLMIPRLTDMQQRILFLLMHDFGVREIARELRVSHPAVIHNRKKVARIASFLLADARPHY